MNIAIIPARGGSKRIPRKNIRPFAGKPMIAHAIGAARASGLFEHVVVSTDDDEIAAIAQEWGAEVPFRRPAELADDHTPTVPVIADAILRCEALGWQPDYVCCIYPCVPLMLCSDIDAALQALETSKCNYSFPVACFPAAIQRALKLDAQGRVAAFSTEYELARNQDLEPAFHDTGQFYWGKRRAWLEQDRIYADSIGMVIPNWRAVDIDTLEDWQRAEIIFQSARIISNTSNGPEPQ